MPCNYSMIFKTFNSDIDKSISKIGMFNKSFWAMQQDLKHGNGIGFSIFGGQSITSKDKQSILDLNTALKNGVKPAKAWATTMTNCSIAAQNQARQCLRTKGDLAELANGLDTTTVSAKAAEIGLKALSIAGNMLLMWGISEVISLINECANASNRLKDSAEQLGSTFSSTKSEIDDYKTQIVDLYKVINDNTSSYEDTYTARQNLLAIQDEMIEKFGNEAEAVSLITQAVNGSTDALDTFTQDKWVEIKSSFNFDSDSSWKKKFSDAWANFWSGSSNNFQRMIKEMEDTEITFYMLPSDDNYKKFSKKLKEDYGESISENGDGFTLSGNLDDIYDKLLNIKSLASDMGVDESVLNNMSIQLESAKKTLNSYEDIYNQHILYDKIFGDSESVNKVGETYEEVFDKINGEYKKYQDAFATGDEETINKAKQNFAEIVQQSTEGISDQSVIDYFNSMYLDLQDVVGAWEFEVKFKSAVEDDDDNFENEVKDAVGKFDTVEDIKNYNPKVASEEQVSAYAKLNQVADDYNLTLDQLIDKMVQMGLLISQPKKDLLKKLIPSKSGFMEQVNPDVATEWVKGLTEEEAKLANSPEFEQALEERKNKIVEEANVTKQSIEDELKTLEKGGNVNLTLRPTIDTSLLNDVGWDAGEGAATVFSSTYSNEDGTVAVNFTPIIADPKTGEYLGVMSPDELQEYAEGVIAGTREDNLNLQIGGKFTGKDAIEQAVNAANNIHDLHEKYFVDTEGNMYQLTFVTEDYNNALQKVKDSQNEITDESSISFLDKFNSSDFAETKEKLLDLAKSGEISEKTLKSTEDYKKLLDETGLSAKVVASRIRNMLSTQEKLSAFEKGISNLQTAYEEFKDKKFVTAQTLEALPETFKELKNFDIFSKIAGDPTSGKAKIKQAFNELATEYIKTQDTLVGITNKNRDSVIANLTDAGITNATEVVDSYLENVSKTYSNLEEARQEWFSKSYSERQEDLKNFQEALKNKDISFSQAAESLGGKNTQLIKHFGEQYSDDYTNWLSLCENKVSAYNKMISAIKRADPTNNLLFGTGAMSEKGTAVQTAKNMGFDVTSKTSYNKYISELDKQALKNMPGKGTDKLTTKNLKEAAKKIRDSYLASVKAEKSENNIAKLDLAEVDFSGLLYSPKTSGKNSKDKKTKSLFDWIEVKLDRINSKAEKFRKTMDLALSYNTKRKQGLNALTQMEKEYETNEKGAKRYQKQADKYTTKNGRYIKGTSGIKVSDVENGKIDITSLTDKQQKAVENYKTWYDKSQNMKQANLELIETMRDMAESIYNLPIDKAEEKIEDYTDTAELASKRIENAKNATEKRSLRNAILQSSKDTLNIRNNAKSETESNYKKLIDKKGNIKGTKIKATGEEIDVIDKKTGKVKYSGKQLEAIQKYNAALEAQKNALKEAELAQEDYVTAIRENVINTMQDIIDDFDNKIQVNDAIISVHSSYKDMKETQGFMAKADDWNGVIAGSLNDVNLKYQEWQKVKAEWDAKDKTALTDSEISEWSAKILDFESQYYEAEKTKADYIKQRNEQEIQNLNDQLELLDSISSEYEALLSLRDAQGAEFRTADEIMTQLNNKDNELGNLEQQKTSAQNLYNDAVSRGADADIVKYGKELNDINAKIFQKKAEQEELVNSLYDEQKNRINKMKEALQKANEEQDKRLQLEKAQYNLLKAQNQRTQKVFNGKEFVYQADEDAIKSAQEELDKLEFDSLIDALDYLADTIIEQAKKENNLYDGNGNRIKTNWEAMSEAGRFSEVSNNLTDPVLTEKGYDVDKLISAETLESMWKNAENNFNNLIYKMPDYSKLSELVSKPTEQKLTISIGDINLSNVNNAEDLARDIVNRLPNTVSQYIRK